MLHHLLLAAEGAHRHAGTDDLAEGGEIRVDVVVALGTTQETRKPVITSSRISRAPNSSQMARSPSRKPGTGGMQFMLPATGLDDDTGDLAAVLGEGFAHRVQIVKDTGERVFGEIGRYARAVGLTQGEGTGAGLDQQGVGMAVVAAFKLDDLVATGVAAASRMALMVASVPELTIRTCSMEGTIWRTFSAISTSISVGAP